jgi:CRP/FNR family transcriptional regulator, cyclic AMP receptor protein
MTTELEAAIRSHPFCALLQTGQIAAIAACARSAHFHTGEYLIREGQTEEELFLIREGVVALELARPGTEAVTLETIGSGDVLGVSRLTPHAAHLDCRARESVLAVAIDNRRLVAAMDADPRLGYVIGMRLLELTYKRLSRVRLQLVDVYR